MRTSKFTVEQIAHARKRVEGGGPFARVQELRCPSHLDALPLVPEQDHDRDHRSD